MGNRRVIGNNSILPWDLPADMKRFKQLTMGKPIIMGRKTFESIGRALNGRMNVILTHKKNYETRGCLVVHSVAEALKKVEKNKEVMVIGGASLFKQFLPRADRMYLTMIDDDFPGDIYFPKFDITDWEITERIKGESNENNPYVYIFLVLERKK